MGKKILYADDEPNIISAHSRILKFDFSDYSIETCSDGLSLKGRLEKNLENVKLIITDNEMPGISGGEIIKEYANKLKIPFILVYGGDKFIGEEAVKNGAFSYVIKPISREEFIEKVGNALKINQLSQ